MSGKLWFELTMRELRLWFTWNHFSRYFTRSCHWNAQEKFRVLRSLIEMSEKKVENMKNTFFPSQHWHIEWWELWAFQILPCTRELERWKILTYLHSWLFAIYSCLFISKISLHLNRDIQMSRSEKFYQILEIPIQYFSIDGTWKLNLTQMPTIHRTEKTTCLLTLSTITFQWELTLILRWSFMKLEVNFVLWKYFQFRLKHEGICNMIYSTKKFLFLFHHSPNFLEILPTFILIGWMYSFKQTRFNSFWRELNSKLYLKSQWIM